MSTAEERVRAMRSSLASDQTENPWNNLWKSGTTPWDSHGKYQPSLVDFLNSGKVELPKGGRAIVPGCGRGYDALLLATKGYEAEGVDISPIAVEAARNWLKEQENAPPNVSFKEMDFFAPSDAEGQYSLAYDYTFFCAITPDLRAKWGERYAALIRPGGSLICGMFPIGLSLSHPFMYKPDVRADGGRTGGPPYSVSPEAYAEVLSPNFERIYQETPTNVSEGHENGREITSVWKRK